MRRAHRVAFGLGVALVGASTAAAAQVRYDAELEEGVARRVLASRPPSGGDATFGPYLDGEVHLALAPLVRVGVYAHYETSPVSGADTRDLASGGLDARIAVPWLRGDVRGYLRVGLGEAGVFASGYGGRRFVAASTGSFSEVPLALGVAYRVYPKLAFTGELGARVGFGFGGGAYSAAGATGDDVLAVGLALGVAWGK